MFLFVKCFYRKNFNFFPRSSKVPFYAGFCRRFKKTLRGFQGKDRSGEHIGLAEIIKKRGGKADDAGIESTQGLMGEGCTLDPPTQGKAFTGEEPGGFFGMDTTDIKGKDGGTHTVGLIEGYSFVASQAVFKAFAKGHFVVVDTLWGHFLHKVQAGGEGDYADGIEGTAFKLFGKEGCLLQTGGGRTGASLYNSIQLVAAV